MTIELLVPGRLQTSQMSCWWACMAMILEYYGRDYTYPWHFRSQFGRPWNRPLNPFGDAAHSSLDEEMARDPTLVMAHDSIYLEPYEWYEHGLPANRRAFETLREISGFRGFDRPAFGRWTAADIETRLRRYGPFVFFGSWNGYPHAILTVGLIERSAGAEVVSIDPIRGFATGESLAEFNHRMVSRMSASNFDSLNPMHWPQSEPVRAVVDHDA